MKKIFFEKITLTHKKPKISQFGPKYFPFDLSKMGHICEIKLPRVVKEMII